MKQVAVFLSASELAEKYQKDARETGALLAQNNYGYVFGGSDVGLMKVMADSVYENNGHIVGVSVSYLKNQNRYENAHEMIVTENLPERKKILNEKADAILVMVGGIGTLDEVTELLELKKHGHHTKPIIFLNTDNFYSGLRMQLEKMETEGFLPKKLADLVHFAETPAEVIEYLDNVLTD